MELVTITDQARLEILKNNPIGKGLNAFRTSFNSICKDRTISCTPDALSQLMQEGTTVWRLFEYLGIKETRREASSARGKTGTRAFMAIRALLSKQHSFMHNLKLIF
jgi:hypothetical protein